MIDDDCTDSIRTPRFGRWMMILADTVLEWIERDRQRQALGVLDERLLHDMAITRADALAEADKPFWKR